ncbi:hypothetical protein LU631_12805 [Erwinia tracheiphila]|uniref:Uncharacterized protein n=1 Tax=Erwinia tracheiphila TaxID=65700 RepID=A0A0M2KEI3_9GAMM|nr:hypothetical protein [Erwinia tracheiphila]AXF76825.1 hypothetical protein AV903_13490 [Erwinia tracheiphila]AXF78640.1 hypothetical protein AV903_25855 [Erwinia tracheiphila]EOS94157.1 hypothetical protein ETR_15151 [Erwinia tracheiphila PSU-1]KKF34121.1 hypothetical protein SY86_24115 [Erwinia tracheiphila]KKF35732.1 hypothetical protein SY86_10335 [Erwinia tracheiphila]
MRRKATQLVNAVGWLERRNVQIRRVSTERARPLLEIVLPCLDLIRRSKELTVTRNGCMSKAYTAMVQGCIIYWSKESHYE